MGAGHTNTKHMAIYSLHTRNSTQHCLTEGWQGGGGSRPRWIHSIKTPRCQPYSNKSSRKCGAHQCTHMTHNTENARNGGAEGRNGVGEGVAVAVGHSTDTTQTWHGGEGGRGHDIPVGHTHNEGGLHKDMARVEGAPRGMSRTHTCLYMAHGTSTAMCVCAGCGGGSTHSATLGMGWWTRPTNTLRGVIARPRDGRH